MKRKITKTKKGLYTCVVPLGRDENGKQIAKRVTAPSKTQVQVLVDQLCAERHIKKYSSLTFKEASDLFIKRKKPMVSGNTYCDYLKYSRKLEEQYPDFLKLRISDISRDDVQDLLNDLRVTLSGKTVRNYWYFVGSVLKSQDVNITGLSLPEKVRPDIYVPDDTTMRKVFSLCRGTDLEVPVLLAAFGPMREGEICALSLDDINGNVVHVHKDIVRVPGGGWAVKETPKTLAGNRFIQYPDAVTDLIRQRGKVTDYNVRTLYHHFQKLLSDNGLPHFRFHDLRHYAASTLHAQGVPDAYIMKRGGWSTDTTLKAVYRHTLADQDKLFTDKANAHFSSFLA